MQDNRGKWSLQSNTGMVEHRWTPQGAANISKLQSVMRNVSHLQSTISQRVVEQCSVAGGFAFRHVFSFNSASE